MTRRRNARRLVRTTAALATALLLTSACSDDGPDEVTTEPTPPPELELPGDPTEDPDGLDDDGDDSGDGGGDDLGSITSGPDEPLDRAACELLLPEDIEGMTAFPGTTFTIVDSLDEPPDPDHAVYAYTSRCGFNVETATSGGTGPWVFVTLTNDRRAFAPDPSWPEYEAVDGVGNDAYWTDGGFTLVVLLDDHVVEIESSVSPDEIDDEIEGRQQLVLALSEVVLPRV
jgi:hypothetical protein